ncbi:MAG: tRNA adenosine(34) deaminase TadA, partial [bacterium]
EAESAFLKGEILVGAVIVCGDEVIAAAHNLKEERHDPTAHAELLAIQAACAYLGRWRLSDCTMYVTLEPCPMCAGALVQSRMRRLVYGAYDAKAGAVGSVVDLLDHPRLNHQVFVTSGVLGSECQDILQRFFENLRNK